MQLRKICIRHLNRKHCFYFEKSFQAIGAYFDAWIFFGDPSKEHRKLLLKREKLKNCISSVLISLDNYILHKTIAHSVAKAAYKFINTHEKKLRNLTKNFVLPFTSSEVVTNLSLFVLTIEQ